MSPGKRLFDIALALVLGALLLVPGILIAAIVLVTSGWPVFHLSERMRAPDEPFRLWKFRSMRPDPGDAGVTGGDKSARVTPVGKVLRRSRLDELPQLWNVLRGDISFVGPRPPLRRYVEMFPELYAEVLRSRPGITGLATLRFHGQEERLLSRTASAAETEAVYCRRCVPRKAALDLIYQRNRTLCMDMALICETAARLLPKRR